MPNFRQKQRTGLYCFATILSFVVSPQLCAADDALMTSLKKCTEIADNSARLICFDAVASMQPDTASKPVASATPTPSEESVPVPLSDDFGKAAVAAIPDDERNQYSAVVTRCEENPQSGQYYFFLENGQVWKQSNYRRLRYRDCAFEVLLSEDTFGYQLYIPSKDRSIRVSRVR